jgi:hypothetical protein
MAKYLRLIFAYPTAVVSNDAAQFTVQIRPMLLESRANYFLEILPWQPPSALSPTSCDRMYFSLACSITWMHGGHYPRFQNKSCCLRQQLGAGCCAFGTKANDACSKHVYLIDKVFDRLDGLDKRQQCGQKPRDGLL